MKKEDLNALKKTVTDNLFKQQKNYRSQINESIKECGLIVLGRDPDMIKHPNDSGYVYMGEFCCGNINSVYTQNDFVFTTMERGCDEGFADAMDWWRLPTDAERELYYGYYPQQKLLNQINDLLNENEVMGVEIDDCLELLQEIKTYFENNKS